MYGKKGIESVIATVIVFILLLGAAIAIWVFFFGSFAKGGSVVDKFFGVASSEIKGLPDLEQKEFESVLDDQEALENLKNKIQSDLDGFRNAGNCDLAETYFLKSMSEKIIPIKDKKVGADLLYRDLKNYYTKIIGCSLDKTPFEKKYCDEAHVFYKEAIKERGEKDKKYTILDKENDKEILGNSLFDIAICYKKAGDKNKATELFNEFSKDYGSTDKYSSARLDIEKKDIVGEFQDKKVLDEYKLYQQEKGDISRRYLEVEAYLRRGDLEPSLLEVNKFIADFIKFSDIAEARQYLANAYYLMAQTELEISKKTSKSLNVQGCNFFETRYKEFSDRGYTRENILRTNALIDPKFLFEVGECFKNANDLQEKYSLHYALLFNRYQKFFNDKFDIPNCPALKSEETCYNQNKFLDLSKMNGEDKYNYKCYWIDFPAFSECRKCSSGCKSYNDNFLNDQDQDLCIADPCDLGCFWANDIPYIPDFGILGICKDLPG